MLERTQAARAGKQATSTVPIVVAVGSDPVRLGFAASFARPGGNITGLAWQSEDLTTKKMELLKETVPKFSRVAILWHPGGDPNIPKAAEGAARKLGLKPQMLEVRSADELAGAFAAAKKARSGAIHVTASPFFCFHRSRLAELAARHRLPAIYEVKEYAQAGGFMSYGPSFPDMYRRAAWYVDKILKGAKPGDLPIGQPMRFELAINPKTAKALGLTISQSVLFRADQVIQ